MYAIDREHIKKLLNVSNLRAESRTSKHTRTHVKVFNLIDINKVKVVKTSLLLFFYLYMFLYNSLTYLSHVSNVSCNS